MNEDQALHDLFTATGHFATAALAKLKTKDPNAWAATMHALNAGSMLSVSTTAALSGLLHATIDIILTTGQTVNLMHVELESDTPTPLN